MATRYQRGDLSIRKRKNGSNVWQFHWYEGGERKSVVLGTVKDLPTKVSALRVVESHRLKINEDNLQQHYHPVTLGTLFDRFLEDYVSRHGRKLTRKTYESIFKNHINPQWGNVCLHKIKTMTVENWLESCPHSRQVKSHIRSLLHTLFNVAIRWELIDHNPITLIRQPKKRLKTPVVLTLEEFRAFMVQLKEPYRTMVMAGPSAWVCGSVNS